jgi:hypothetical protein
MNCKEFEFSIIQRLNFKVHINFDYFPFYKGDIILKQIDLGKRQKTCNQYYGPRFYDAYCNRWTIFFGTDPNRFLDLSGVAPGLGADQIEWTFLNAFKPWDDADPFYARALDMWDATPIAERFFRFFINLPEYNVQFLVNFEQARDGATGTIIWLGTDPEVMVGSATLTLEKK